MEWRGDSCFTTAGSSDKYSSTILTTVFLFCFSVSVCTCMCMRMNAYANFYFTRAKDVYIKQCYALVPVFNLLFVVGFCCQIQIDKNYFQL